MDSHDQDPNPTPADANDLPVTPAPEEPAALGQDLTASPEFPAPPVADVPNDAAPTAGPIVVPGDRLGIPAGASRSIPTPLGHPSYVFLAVVAVVSLVADLASKFWAERTLDGYPGFIDVWPNHIAFVLAKNKGGAWGLLQGTSEHVRRPFFLLVSVAAIAFIVTLYRRIQPRQRALKWGLPLVLGGALGNVFDRVRYGHVIDFIDFHMVLQGRDHHWPTFNVADIAICVGVGLMAIDMFTSKRTPRSAASLAPPPPANDHPPSDSAESKFVE